VSLRRRITGAAALAVAAVAIMLGVTGYLTTRSHLVGQLKQELRQRADQFQKAQPNGPDNEQGEPKDTEHGEPSDQGSGDDGGGQQGQGSHGITAPTAPPLGGAPGYFQTVGRNGTVATATGAKGLLPVTARVLAVARSGRGSFFTTATVEGVHVMIYTVGDADDHYAVEVAQPLTSIDDVLHGLGVSYILLMGGGVLLAVLLAAVIARAAVAPINRFSEMTEQVTSALDKPRRLEEMRASELKRLARSFNQTLDALERSIVAQQHLIADASHELRTPMAALRSNIQIFLESDKLPQGEREELQEAIIAELDELTQVVADVLELARGAAPSEHTEPIELDQIVDEAIARTRRRAATLEFDIDLQPTTIVNSPDRVSRAVTNVIDNARKWSPPEGRVEVALRDGVLSVRDHGPGFKDVDLPYVFDRFYRAHEARRMSGSGLGLAIVKQAAEAHGGFAAASNAPDGGGLVRISFGPWTRRAVEPTEQSSAPATG
jgi:two-component system, OmpR family, sensor histidine kinase MprB